MLITVLILFPVALPFLLNRVVDKCRRCKGHEVQDYIGFEQFSSSFPRDDWLARPPLSWFTIISVLPRRISTGMIDITIYIIRSSSLFSPSSPHSWRSRSICFNCFYIRYTAIDQDLCVVIIGFTNIRLHIENELSNNYDFVSPPSSFFVRLLFGFSVDIGSPNIWDLICDYYLIIQITVLGFLIMFHQSNGYLYLLIV